MIPQTEAVNHEKRLTALAVIDARLREEPADSAFLMKTFFADMVAQGASSRESSLMLMAGMADMLMILVDMIDTEDPHRVVDQMRARLMEMADHE